VLIRRSGVTERAEGGVSVPNKFACAGFVRVCFTTANGTESESVPASSSGISSRIEGSSGREGDNTHLFVEYFVRIKFSILESEGI